MYIWENKSVKTKSHKNNSEKKKKRELGICRMEIVLKPDFLFLEECVSDCLRETRLIT